jgi:hypothetical protein
MRTPPAAALEAHRILTADLRRAAEQGKLRLAPELAAQMIMSANVGVCLMLVARPATFTDETLSRRVRDAVHATAFTPEVTDPGARTSPSEAPTLPATATRLGALLRRNPSPAFSLAETGLLTEWLDRLSNTPDQDL